MESLTSRTQSIATESLGSTPRKPLYLATSKRIRITAEGEAIAVHQTPAGLSRFPVARIARIICNRHADWSGKALALCLSRQITITWVDGGGNGIGSASPRLATPLSLHHSLEIWLEQPDWDVKHENWLRKRRMDVLLQFTARSLAAGRPFCRETFETQKREFVYNNEISSAFAPVGIGWCHALVVARLARKGLQTRYFGYDGGTLELADDLSRLLWAELNLDCGSLTVTANKERVQMLFFENWARQRQDRLIAHLAHLKRYVAQENNNWP